MNPGISLVNQDKVWSPLRAGGLGEPENQPSSIKSFIRIRYVLGNSEPVRFWRHFWCGEEALEETFPLLLALLEIGI